VKEIEKSPNEYVLAGRNNFSSQRNHLHINLTDEDHLVHVNLVHFDRIIYVAQSRNYKSAEYFTNEIFAINHRAPSEIARKAHLLGIPFLYASTGSVYRSKHTPHLENDPLASDGDLSIYTASKIATEKCILEFENCHVIRPFYIYGENSDEHMLLPTLLKKILNMEPIEIRGEYGLIFNPIHSNDAARASLLALESPSKVVNVAGPTVTNLIEVISILGEITNKKIKIKRSEGISSSSIGGTTRLMDSGFKFNYSLAEGLKDFVKNYKN
jgi:nucleoside-diphosphate-sugar epimerase